MENSKKESFQTPSKINSFGPSIVNRRMNSTQMQQAISNSSQSSGNGSGNGSGIEYRTPHSIRRRNGTFHSLPAANTPTPPSRLKRILNPFEDGLTERLHLPFIASPSLFHRPATPQHCSTQVEFEWTIDDVSSLNPANVEAHETQFDSHTDPETEARAQAAISSYFKENIYVPSPVDCPLRGQKIILKDIIEGSGLRRKKRTRDGCCQTELTFPAKLPKELEDALAPFFSYSENQQQSPNKENCDITMNSTANTTIDYEARDASLRRKLFQTSATSSELSCLEHEREILQLDSPTPQSPQMDLQNIRSKRFLTPRQSDKRISDSPLSSASLSPVKRESFGCISPISKDLNGSPVMIRRVEHETTQQNMSHNSASSLYRSTPDRSTIIRSFSATSVNMSIDGGMSMMVSHQNTSCFKRKSFHLSDDDHSMNLENGGNRSSSYSNETADYSYDDIMQMSQSSNGSQTPVRSQSKHRRRSVNRKNLSLSFSSFQADGDDGPIVTPTAESELTAAGGVSRFIGSRNGQTLNRSDSGFNEMDESKKAVRILSDLSSGQPPKPGFSSFPQVPTTIAADVSMIDFDDDL